MANNSVNINVNVSDNGTVKAVTKKVQALKDLLTQTATIASTINVGAGGGGGGGTRPASSGTTTTGGTAGSRGTAGPRAPASSAPSSASSSYTMGRGVAGTGASGRDFAREAEGLGGVVRLYATYAANIYAVGAAFRALSEAANTTNIIQGLNQLGATSGVALGTLAKQFADASGGAISFRESMQATAQATSAGLSSKQFLQLGEVAKKASQALGIGMSDAVSRLTRGITKMEPELIDELGLFTKLGKSTDDYAKSIGKTTGSLTDFEKRQAFANAVLKEGIGKYSEIDIPTNPYDKLAASLANLSYQTLSVVNKALGPLVDMLSRSPGTLLAIVSGLALVMIRQAIPALTQFRASMEANAVAAQHHATETNNVIAGLRQSGAAMTTHQAIMQRVAGDATRAAASYTILSNAVENTHVTGAVSAFRLLRAELALNTAGFGFLARAALTARGAIIIAAVGITAAVSAFAGWIMIIGSVITGVKLLADYLSNNIEESAKFTDSIKTQEEYTKALTATTEKYKGSLTVESLIAKAKAFDNLSDGIIATSEALKKAEAKPEWLDNITEWFKGKWGGDLRSVFAETTTDSIIEGLQSIDDAAIRKQAEDSIMSALDITDISRDTIKKALKNADPTKVGKAVEENKNRVTAATGPVQGLADGFKEVNQEFLALSNSLVNNDPLSKFGASLIKQSEIMAGAFEKPTTALALLNSIMKDTSQIKAFPPESQKAILEVARSYREISDDVAIYQARIVASKDMQAKGAMNQNLAGQGFVSMSGGSDEGKQMQALGVQMEATATRMLAVTLQKQKEAQDKVAKALSDAVEYGFKLIEGPLTRAIAQAGIDSQKTLLSYLPKTPETAGMAADLELKSIDLKIEEIKTQRELIDAIKLASLADDRRALDADLKLVKFESEAGQAIVKRMQDNTAQREAILDPSKINKKTAGSAVASIYQQNVGYQAKLVELESQKTQIRIKKAVDVALAEIDETVTKSQDKLDDLTKKNADFYKSAAFNRLSDISQLDERTNRAKDEQEKSDAIARAKASKDTTRAETVAKLATTPEVKAEANKAVTYAKERETALVDQQQAAKELASTAAENAKTQLVITKSLDEQLSILDRDSKLGDIKAQRATQELDAQAQKLDFDLSMGKLSEDEYQNQKRINDLKSIELETASQLRKVTEDYNREQLDISQKLANPDIVGSDKELQLINQRIASKELYASGTEAVKAAGALKAESVNLLSSVDDRTKTYSAAFTNTVGSMSDALVDFALTGKASFGDMIQSMIIDLIKFEQKRMMMAAFSAAGGSGGILGALGSIAGSAASALFGYSGATAGELNNFGGYGSANSGLGNIEPGGYSGPVYTNNALGGVYDQGRVAFAKGGAFSNTIVNRPTTFAFAKGAGLMGESGPEAIMPLKRGANGSLGVQGGGSSVDVVVNNYGTEKATTKESTDSRGNRRIEVIVGDMTAAEMTRPNSPVQTSMRSTFGLAPSLTRR